MTRARDGGFTTIELLASLTLFAIVAASLETLLLGTVKSNGYASRMSAAVGLAEDKLEVLRDTSYAALASGSDAQPLTEVLANGGIYTRSWTVSDATPVANTKTIRVDVSWTDGSLRQVELRTIVYQPPA